MSIVHLTCIFGLGTLSRTLNLFLLAKYLSFTTLSNGSETKQHTSIPHRQLKGLRTASVGIVCRNTHDTYNYHTTCKTNAHTQTATISALQHVKEGQRRACVFVCLFVQVAAVAAAATTAKQKTHTQARHPETVTIKPRRVFGALA